MVTASAEDNCTQKFWTGAVDKAAAREQQQSVNDGHQPWRTDDVVAVAEEVIRSRKAEWGDNSVVLGTPKVLVKTGGEAMLFATSKDGRIRYDVTLIKNGFLLSSADNRWSRVIWLPSSVERNECPVQSR